MFSSFFFVVLMVYDYYYFLLFLFAFKYDTDNLGSISCRHSSIGWFGGCLLVVVVVFFHSLVPRKKKESFCGFVHVYLLFKKFWAWFLSPPKGFVCCIPEDGFFVSRLLIFSPQKQERIPDPSLLQGIQSYLGDEGRRLCAL